MSKIKYPCAMMGNIDNNLIVWFSKGGHGIVVNVGDSHYETRELRTDFIMSAFQPYVRRIEYEYLFAYRVTGTNHTNITCSYYKNLADALNRFSVEGGCGMQIIELSKREVQ